ncbi:DUF2911 domain-containing protein [bacterium]|nr:DUF2911 domain-containing protein [bacterium]
MRFSIAILLLFTALTSSAQKFPELDKSPADISLYKLHGEAVAKVVYSRPQKNGRTVFGKLVKYGKVWRTGANECTEITFYVDVLIDGKTVKAGTYALFSIPGEAEWTLILNSETNKWGSFFYKEKYDVLRVKVATETTKEVVEAFAIVFDKSTNGFDMLMAWDTVMVRLPIALAND